MVTEEDWDRIYKLWEAWNKELEGTGFYSVLEVTPLRVNITTIGRVTTEGAKIQSMAFFSFRKLSMEPESSYDSARMFSKACLKRIQEYLTKAGKTSL